MAARPAVSVTPKGAILLAIGSHDMLTPGEAARLASDLMQAAVEASGVRPPDLFTAKAEEPIEFRSRRTPGWVRIGECVDAFRAGCV
ncbi:hypothetical protein [Tropicimonas sp. IMCC34043]|uniref:hypothetical protein n=1 Tax=Tropicimonas sp. IMCC34043 TaxID=2248760 RepID=UPI000E21CC37|nr:hypothetical protein [Tropicimonas sp. IMCC34043]